ncbi:MAG: aminomethyl-transferring glycine dehydrogenase subunit GcvPA [Clostridia bacterium]|nr:aminomethyl-transferring glycine dehydrogenase subunit GcvPA [Clostridia bacterium]
MKKIVHPYIPNSVPAVQEAMLKEIGANSIDELFDCIPEEIRFKGKLNVPRALSSEYELRRHVDSMLNRNVSCEEYISFLGAGCYQHHVPAVCEEIAGRSEFLTAYAGEPYEDHGRFMSLFEYTSMMAELLDVDVVNVPTYSWGQASATSLRMAGRITKRDVVLVASNVSPERYKIMKNYCGDVMTMLMVATDDKGLIDIQDLKNKLDEGVAGLYFENPSYHGVLETQAREIADLLHENGSLMMVGVDPTSLGVIAPPSSYGADIITGDVQALGNHMNYGGGMGGFIASDDREEIVMEYPSRLFGIAPTSKKGELGFGDVAYDRTSFGVRENGKEFVGTHAALHGIVAGVYLALMGPQGMVDLGQSILKKSHYAAKCMGALEGVKLCYPETPHFKEFAVDFSDTGMTVQSINQKLLEQGIFGGVDLSSDFPYMGQSALYCVTEVQTKASIDRLIEALQTILKGCEA